MVYVTFCEKFVVRGRDFDVFPNHKTQPDILVDSSVSEQLFLSPAKVWCQPAFVSRSSRTEAIEQLRAGLKGGDPLKSSSRAGPMRAAGMNGTAGGAENLGLNGYPLPKYNMKQKWLVPKFKANIPPGNLWSRWGRQHNRFCVILNNLFKYLIFENHGI